MKKYLCITSIILGLFADIILLYGLYNFKSAPIIGLSGFSLMRKKLLNLIMSSSPNFFMTFIGTIGFSFAIMDLTKYKTSNKKFLSIIGLILNFIPAFLFLLLLFTIFIPLVLMPIFMII